MCHDGHRTFFSPSEVFCRVEIRSLAVLLVYWLVKYTGLAAILSAELVVSYDVGRCTATFARETSSARSVDMLFSLVLAMTCMHVA